MTLVDYIHEQVKFHNEAYQSLREIAYHRIDKGNLDQARDYLVPMEKHTEANRIYMNLLKKLRTGKINSLS